jgi:hypothetical protein
VRDARTYLAEEPRNSCFAAQPGRSRAPASWNRRPGPAGPGPQRLGRPNVDTSDAGAKPEKPCEHAAKVIVGPCPPSGAPRPTAKMIVYHGTTVDCRAGIEAEGLRPGSFVAPSRDLASDYAWRRAMDLGADGCVLFELDIPDAAIVDAPESWWWAPNQKQLPYGCPPTCILSVDTSDPPRFSIS